jgi:hypothetical protein
MAKPKRTEIEVQKKIDELEKLSLKAIDDHNLMFVGDIWAFIGISRTNFYDYKLDKKDSIKGALEKNKITTKSNLKAKWYKSSNPTLQIALMRLISEDEERKKLSQQYHDVTSDGKEVNTGPIIYLPSKLPDNYDKIKTDIQSKSDQKAGKK